MARLRSSFAPLFLLGLLLTPIFTFSGLQSVSADDAVVGEEEDEDMSVDDEDEEETVVISDEGKEGRSSERPAEDVEEEEEEEEEEDMYKTSPDAKSTILFTNTPETKFYAGQVVKSLIGFTNIGKESNFVVSFIEASFRYPEDFTYFIQNFSKVYYESYIPPLTESSFIYEFTPSESFYSRPFGLVVNIYYKNEEGIEFRDAVFNGTVKIVEVEEQFDAESFFMYVLMISGLLLLMFIVHYVWTTVKRGGRTATKKAPPPIERGTQKKKNQVDESWLPEGTIQKKSPRKQHTSPRNRQKGGKPLTTPNVD